MEFIQFHPTCLYHPKAKSFLITEAVRGEGGILRNSRGEEFMERYHPLGSLAPRDIVARAIDSGDEAQRARNACCSISRTSAASSYRSVSRIFTRPACDSGSTLRKQPIPVVPAAHYQCGGVKTDVNGATSIAGPLCGRRSRPAPDCMARIDWRAIRCWKAGRARIAPAKRSGARTADRRMPSRAIPLPEWESGNVQNVDELVVIYHNWDEIRRLMWDYVGHRSHEQTTPARESASAKSPARDPRVLLEFHRYGRLAGTSQHRYSGRVDRGFRIKPQKRAAGCISTSTTHRSETAILGGLPCWRGTKWNG